MNVIRKVAIHRHPKALVRPRRRTRSQRGQRLTRPTQTGATPDALSRRPLAQGPQDWAGRGLGSQGGHGANSRCALYSAIAVTCSFRSVYGVFLILIRRLAAALLPCLPNPCSLNDDPPIFPWSLPSGHGWNRFCRSGADRQDPDRSWRRGGADLCNHPASPPGGWADRGARTAIDRTV